MRVCTACKRLLPADADRCPSDGAAAQVVDTLPRDTRLGAYRIDRLLGEGGMGFVYEATHEVLNRRSAIKMLRPELARQPQVVTRFLNEARAVNLIDHPNIVNVYDYGDHQHGSVYFVMEFLEGETLDELMRRRQVLPVPDQLVEGPANVFVVAREGHPCFVKLLDFGVAQLRGSGAVQGLTLAGAVLGTPQYMSPEQISGGVVDARSDVWSLGVMLYRAATGQAPFKGEEFAELADKILHHTPRPADEIAPLPPALSQLITRCLERNIAERCPSIAEVIAGLERTKQACQLDDDAIRAAVIADSGAAGDIAAAAPRDRTRDSIGGSVPRYQGAADRRAPWPDAGAARPRSRLGAYVAIAAIACALGGVAYAVRERRAPPIEPRAGSTGSAAGKPPTIGEAVSRGVGTPTALPAGRGTSPVGSIVELIAAGDTAAWHRRAEQDLRDAIHSDRLQQQGFAVDALALAHVPAGAPLLYLALQGAPEVRVKAARALGELGLPDAAPRLRDALAASGDKIRVEIAASLYRLGDKDARAILLRATDDPAARLTAALAMAESGDDAGRAALADIVAADPPGRDAWRRAAGGLAKLGDDHARTLLEGELAQPDATRSIGAAELLARAGDARAREQLARVAADRDASAPGMAAAALARLGDPRALGWVAGGLASRDVDERMLALAICGRLAATAASHTRAIGKLAADDPDLRVRMTAEAVLLGL
ncbi:MAG: hypothetical protein E6J90_21140 [Deltaproteobacteria bacterium]|nr:MAG: hypothetical protein E6J90_21140 [Deltaproteobacteria bacterium]